MNAARILDQARRRAGITQRELARRTGMPQPSISRIERGVVSPTVDTLERLLRACDLELEALPRPRDGDVDRTLIDERLRMTPDERVHRAVPAGRTKDLEHLEWLKALRDEAEERGEG